MAPKAKKTDEKVAVDTEDKKRKAEADAAEAAKKAKLAAEEEAEDAEADEAAKEKEADAAKIVGKVIATPVQFQPNDTTLNVVSTPGGKMLMQLSEGGLQYLVAGARANVGLKSGRYLFEVRVIEALSPMDAPPRGGRVPNPRQFVRLGFSVAGSSLFLGDTADSFCFDSEGYFISNSVRTRPSQKCQRDQVLGVLLNLDKSSPNANTVSIFRDGERISAPQALPEHLVGKTFYPHVSYRNVTLQCNFGPMPLAPLPFKCHMVAGAAEKDSVVTAAPKEGAKFEVVFPVGLPEEGVFDWVDGFMEKNPDYVELSDRAILDWAQKSGIHRVKGYANSVCQDKPEMGFGLPSLDDFSVQKVLATVAPIVPRNYVVMELKSNLVQSERAERLERFSTAIYKKVARVMVGEPKVEFKKRVQQRVLKVKKTKAEQEYRVKVAARERVIAQKKRAREAAEAKKTFEENRKKAAAERLAALEEKKKELEKKKSEEAAEKGEPAAEEKTEEAAKTEAKKEEEAPATEAKKDETEEKDEKEAPAEEAKEEVKEEDEDPPEIEMEEPELTEEETKLWFAPQEVPDLTPNLLKSSLAKFTLPEKAEGFDDVKFEWQAGTKATDYVKKWVLERKLATPIEDLQPSDWFKEKYALWKKSVAEWVKAQEEYKKSGAHQKKLAEKKKEGEEDDEEEVDIFSIENLLDIGKGEPLFANFDENDWMLLDFHAELNILVHAFAHDANDPDRPGISETHLPFYFMRYYLKPLCLKTYGCEKLVEAVKLVRNTISLTSEQILESKVSDLDDLTIFVKYTEESRRERQRRVDAGDDNAKLKFVKPAPPPAPAPKPVVMKPPAAPIVPPAAPTAPTAPTMPAPTAPGAPVAQKGFAPRPLNLATGATAALTGGTAALTGGTAALTGGAPKPASTASLLGTAALLGGGGAQPATAPEKGKGKGKDKGKDMGKGWGKGWKGGKY